MSGKEQPLLSLRLRLVAAVDFRHGIPHHVGELRRQKKLRNLGPRECVLLISQTGLQLAFVFRDRVIEAGPRRGEVGAISHYRVQLTRHTPWNPTMLRTYAEEAGIEIQGARRFEDHFKPAVRALAKPRPSRSSEAVMVH